MCVIINLPARVEFPFEKLKAAATRNDDGWGILIKDRGKLEMHKEYPKGGNDPDDIYKWLNDAIECERYLHLRMCTHGEVSTANAHPFLINDASATNTYWLMHNGVFSTWGANYGRQGDSDTVEFNNRFLKPLFERVQAFTDKPLDDDFLKMVLKKECSTGNRLLLASSAEDEDALMIGGEWFRDDEGWYASNNYYFEEPKQYKGYQSAVPFRTETTGTRTTGGSGTGTGSTTQRNFKELTYTKLSQEVATLRDNLDKKHFSQLEMDVYDLLAIENLEELHDLSPLDLEDILKLNPKAGSMLIIHLLAVIEAYKEDAPFTEDIIEGECEVVRVA